MQLISDGYRAQQRQMHTDPSYGTASVGYAPIVAQAMRRYEVRSVLDYGAGKQRLRGALADKIADIDYTPFEPADPLCCDAPAPAPFVACIDVLEHIEPDCLDAVLDDLQRVTLRAGCFTVATGPAKKTLPDGRNAHLIIEPIEWWLPKIMARFDLQVAQRMPGGFFVIVESRQ
jgi:hypothetical protein